MEDGVLPPAARTEQLCRGRFAKEGVGIQAADAAHDIHKLLLPSILPNPGRLFNAIYRAGNTIWTRNPQDDAAAFKIGGKRSVEFNNTDASSDLIIPNGLGLREAVCAYVGRKVWTDRHERTAVNGTAFIFHSIPVNTNIHTLCRAIDKSGEYESELHTSTNTLVCSPTEPTESRPPARNYCVSGVVLLCIILAVAAWSLLLLGQ
jgi:hypothetical protein